MESDVLLERDFSSWSSHMIAGNAYGGSAQGRGEHRRAWNANGGNRADISASVGGSVSAGSSICVNATSSVGSSDVIRLSIGVSIGDSTALVLAMVVGLVLAVALAVAVAVAIASALA